MLTNLPVTSSDSSVPLTPIRVGLVGTGYAAKLRAGALQADPRAHLLVIAGYTSQKTAAFSQTYGAETASTWTDLIARSDIDLVIISTINRDHGPIVRAALQAGKHVVVEYPLDLDLNLAEESLTLAKSRQRLLHVEHIELLGGLHQAMQKHLPRIGVPGYVRYSTLNPQHPAPRKWSYQAELFGFPLMGALSRIHRLTNLFGEVATVACQNRYDTDAIAPLSAGFHNAFLCTAQFRFKSGLVAEVTYGKGDKLWRPMRRMEVHGGQGGLIIDGDQGTLILSEGSQPIEVGTRRGLFAKDMTMVLDHLLEGCPLYVTPAESLYALKVADAARRSAETGQVIRV